MFHSNFNFLYKIQIRAPILVIEKNLNSTIEVTINFMLFFH